MKTILGLSILSFLMVPVPGFGTNTFQTEASQPLVPSRCRLSVGPAQGVHFVGESSTTEARIAGAAKPIDIETYAYVVGLKNTEARESLGDAWVEAELYDFLKIDKNYSDELARFHAQYFAGLSTDYIKNVLIAPNLLSPSEGSRTAGVIDRFLEANIVDRSKVAIEIATAYTKDVRAGEVSGVSPQAIRNSIRNYLRNKLFAEQLSTNKLRLVFLHSIIPMLLNVTEDERTDLALQLMRNLHEFRSSAVAYPHKGVTEYIANAMVALSLSVEASQRHRLTEFVGSIRSFSSTNTTRRAAAIFVESLILNRTWATQSDEKAIRLASVGHTDDTEQDLRNALVLGLAYYQMFRSMFPVVLADIYLLDATRFDGVLHDSLFSAVAEEIKQLTPP
jgi:hypothetical protein